MNYQIGDQVVHSTYGPGKITAIDEKCLGGQTHQYYVVDTGQLTLWVRMDPVGEDSIRPPIRSFEFKELFNILRSPAEGLSDQHDERKNQLNERMNRRNLANICSVIRDLTIRSQGHNLNYNDRAVLKHAEDYLLDEWVLSLGTARQTASRELEGMLKEAQSLELGLAE